MRTATRALAWRMIELGLGGKPGTDGFPRVGFAVQIDMDERRTHHAAHVGVRRAIKMSANEVLGDFLGAVVAPAFEDGLLATLLLVAAIGWHERMHGPAKLIVVKLRCLQAVEFVDVGRNGKAHAATGSDVMDW